MSVGVLLAVLLIVAMTVAYSGGVWLLTSPASPLPRRWRRRRIDRTVRRETADLDDKIIALTRRMVEDDAT